MIDSHQHFWQYDPSEYEWINEKMSVLQRDFLPGDLFPILNDLGIKGSVAVQARQSIEETEFLIALTEKNDFIKGVIGWLDLKAADLVANLTRFSKSPKVKGFRHIIQGEKDSEYLLNSDFIKGIKLLGQYNFTYDILIYEHQFPATLEFIKHFNDQTFILDHIGKPDIKKGISLNWKKGIKEISKYPQMYCKVSGMVTEADWNSWTEDTFKEYLDFIVESFGVDRIMYGSDWPVCLLATDRYAKIFDILNNYFADFSDIEKSMIFGDNANTCYRLEKSQGLTSSIEFNFK